MTKLPLALSARRRSSISAREVLNAIDPSKLGPESPLHQLLTQKRRAPSQDKEHEEQVRLFAWAKDQEPIHPELRWLFAVPNFAGKLGRWTAKHGARLKAEGRKPGVLDVWWPIARGGYHGFVAELKAGKNKLTLDQREWLEHLIAEGYAAGVFYSAEAVIAALRAYLTLERPTHVTPLQAVPTSKPTRR